MLRTSLVVTLALSLVGCAASPPATPVSARPLQPGANERVALDQLLVIVDASGSVEDTAGFAREKVLVQAYAASVPDGSYEAGAVAFGGAKRQRYPLEKFDRSRFRENAAAMEHLRLGTPVYKVLEEEKVTFSTRSGKAAVVIFSDGLITDEFGREVEAERTLVAARELAAAHSGQVCFHTVQVGADPAGAAALRQIAGVTTCGSSRSAQQASSESALHAFHRDVFIARSLPAVAAPPAKVSQPPRAQGPWSVAFGFDSADVESRYDSELDQVAAELRRDASARVRLNGHTDAKGNAKYNKALSQRRAEAIRAELVSRGVASSRIEVNAYGPEMPLAPNDSDQNRGRNRRTEIELIR